MATPSARCLEALDMLIEVIEVIEMTRILRVLRVPIEKRMPIKRQRKR